MAGGSRAPRARPHARSRPCGSAGGGDADHRLVALAGGLFGAVLLALEGVLPGLFSNDPAVVERARAIWLLFAALMPLNGVVFALDGILIGAGDTRFLM